MRSRVRFLCPFLLVALTFSAFAADARATEDESRAVLEKIRDARATTWRWQRLMGVRLTRTYHQAERTTDIALRRRILETWRERAAKARRAAMNPPHLRAWLCIHRYEGPWDANTGNGYYGGLQMDMTFQRQYGAFLLRKKGPAHRWRPIEQIWVAERARRSGRGFYPWPNAARMCGLI